MRVQNHSKITMQYLVCYNVQNYVTLRHCATAVKYFEMPEGNVNEKIY